MKFLNWIRSKLKRSEESRIQLFNIFALGIFPVIGMVILYIIVHVFFSSPTIP